MKKKGIILELRTKEAVVVNDLCEYEKIKRTEGMFVGQMVEYSIPYQTKAFNHVSTISSVAAVLFLIVVGYLAFILNMNPKVYAYVDLDINPSMEFSIDKNNTVIDLKPLNSDAEELISTFEIKKKNINDAISYILKSLDAKGYISSDNENLILLAASYSEDSEISENTPENTIEKTINTIKRTIESVENKNISVKVIYTEPNLRKKSIDNNMSMGRYVLYKNAQKIGANITPNAAKSAKVKDLISYYRLEDSLPPVSNVSNSMEVSSDLPAISSTQSNLDQSNKEKAPAKSNDTSSSMKPPVRFYSTDETSKDKILTPDSPKNNQGGSGIPPIFGDPKKPLEGFGMPPVFDDPKKPQEGPGTPPVPVDPQRPPNGPGIPPISDDPKKPQEGPGIPPVPNDPKGPPEGPGIPHVPNDPQKPQEGPGTPPVPVDPNRPPEGPGTPPVPVDPQRPHDGPGTPPVPHEPQRPPDGPGTPPVPNDPQRPHDGPGTPPVPDDPKGPPDGPGTPPVPIEPKGPQGGHGKPPFSDNSNGPQGGHGRPF